MKNSISKIGSLATMFNTWLQKPGRFRFFSFPFRISIMLVLLVKIDHR